MATEEPTLTLGIDSQVDSTIVSPSNTFASTHDFLHEEKPARKGGRLSNLRSTAPSSTRHSTRARPRVNADAQLKEIDSAISNYTQHIKDFEKARRPFLPKELQCTGEQYQIPSEEAHDSDAETDTDVDARIANTEKAIIRMTADTAKVEEQIEQENNRKNAVTQQQSMKSQEYRRAEVILKTHAFIVNGMFSMCWEKMCQLAVSVPSLKYAEVINMVKSLRRKKVEQTARRVRIACSTINRIRPCSQLIKVCKSRSRRTISQVLSNLRSLKPRRSPLPVPTGGLRNLGNTCFMNSALNTLYYILPLNSFISARDNHQKTGLGLVFQQFCELYQRGSDVTPLLYGIMNNLREFGDGRQHCSHSFILKFLMQLDKDLPCTSPLSPEFLAYPISSRYNNYQKNKCKELHSIFSGLVENVFTCSKCFNHWVNYSYFRTVDLPLTDMWLEHEGTVYFGPMDFYNSEVARRYMGNGTADEYTAAFRTWDPWRLKDNVNVRQQRATLDLCIQYWLRANLMTADNPFDCATCGCETQHFKQSFLRHLSPVLMIHFQRYNEATGAKLDTYVDCPKILRLEQYFPGCGVYELVGVINHSGSLHSGHYTAYVKAQGRWFLTNDSYVTEVPEGTDLFRTAYVVTYIRR